MRTITAYTALLAGACATGKQPNAKAQAALIAASAGVEVLRLTNQRVFREAAEKTLEKAEGEGKTIADYREAMKPLIAAFRERGSVVDDLGSVLRATVAAVSAQDATQRSAIVRQAMLVVARAAAVFSDDTALPGIPLPPELREAMQLLAQFLTFTAPQPDKPGTPSTVQP